MRDRSLLILPVLVVVALVAPVFASDPKVVMGVPRPSIAPTCSVAGVGIHGDANDSCIYACVGTNRAKVAGSGCVVPTSTASPTPTVTATATPTPTVTATP